VIGADLTGVVETAEAVYARFGAPRRVAGFAAAAAPTSR
jgi:hypothetical protein